jgi:hypothetical protein
MAGPPAVPRLISPLSTSTVTSQHPTLRWTLSSASGTPTVDLCSDRACTTPISGAHATVDPSLSFATVDSALPMGVVFWRVNVSKAGMTNTSATWEFFVGARTTPGVDTSWGATLDVNGDGFADLLVGATGSAVLFPGSATGLVTAPAMTTTLTSGDNGYASSATAAGDVNGDGFGDVLVSGIYADEDGGTNAGKTYLYLGSKDGLAVSGIKLDGPQIVNGGFGIASAAVGDFNGDGYGDVAVSASGESQKDTGGVQQPCGGVTLFFGSPQGLTMSAPVLAPTADVTSGLQFGTNPLSLAGGDFNADGLGDLVVGAAGYGGTTGRVYVYFGSKGGTVGAPVNVDPYAIGSETPSFGTALTSAGDVNGDGYDDLVVGAPGTTYSEGGPAARYGVFQVFTGVASGAPVFAVGVAGGDPSPGLNDGVSNFASVVSGAGDLDGDGYADFLVAAPQYGTAAPFGRVHVFYHYVGAPRVVTIASPAPAGSFGTAIAQVGSVKGSAGSWKSNFVVSAGTTNVYLYTDGTPPTQVAVAAPAGIVSGWGSTMAQLVRDFVGWWTRA